LKEGFANFAEKYNFLCINPKKKGTEQPSYVGPDGKLVLNEFETAILHSFSRFPTEIIEDKIFIVKKSDIY
jgi:hypothetical protein